MILDTQNVPFAVAQSEPRSLSNRCCGITLRELFTPDILKMWLSWSGFVKRNGRKFLFCAGLICSYRKQLQSLSLVMYLQLRTWRKYKICVFSAFSPRVQCWLLFLATSLIPIMVTHQRSYMTSQMTPPPQVNHTQISLGRTKALK